MNVSAAERETILKKVDGTFSPLSGAEFRILRYDRTPVTGIDINGNPATTFVSGESGVYFAGVLAFGTYYLHETQTPDGGYRALGDGTNWYRLTVDAGGVSVSGRLSSAP